MIVNTNMDTGACYGVSKCGEIVFRKGKMTKEEGLAVLEEKIDALDPPPPSKKKKKRDLQISWMQTGR